MVGRLGDAGNCWTSGFPLLYPLAPVCWCLHLCVMSLCVYLCECLLAVWIPVFICHFGQGWLAG